MIVLIYLLLYGLIFMFSYCKFHRGSNVASIFSGIWFFFGILSCYGLYGLRTPSVNIHIYVWIFVVIVDFIFIKFAVTDNLYVDSSDTKTLLNYKRANKIQFIAFVLIIPLLFKLLPVLIKGGMSDTREMYFSGTNFSTMYYDLIFRTIPMAFFNALVVYYAFYSFETRKYKYLLNSLLNAILITVINGGRYAVVLLIYTLLILLVTKKINITEFRRYRIYTKKVKKIGFVLLIVLLFTTAIRGQELLKNSIVYFAGSLSFLDYIVEHPIKFALDKRLFGYLTFGAVIEPIVLALKVLGVTTAKVPSYEFNIYCQEYYNVGEGTYISFNANTSILYYFLRDFGFVGVVVGALFIGCIAVKSYNSWKKGNMFWGLVFCYIGNVLFNSLMTYQLFGPSPLFIIFVYYYCTRKKHKEQTSKNF